MSGNNCPFLLFPLRRSVRTGTFVVLSCLLHPLGGTSGLPCALSRTHVSVTAVRIPAPYVQGFWCGLR